MTLSLYISTADAADPAGDPALGKTLKDIFEIAVKRDWQIRMRENQAVKRLFNEVVRAAGRDARNKFKTLSEEETPAVVLFVGGDDSNAGDLALFEETALAGRVFTIPESGGFAAELAKDEDNHVGVIRSVKSELPVILRHKAAPSNP